MFETTRKGIPSPENVKILKSLVLQAFEESIRLSLAGVAGLLVLGGDAGCDAYVFMTLDEKKVRVGGELDVGSPFKPVAAPRKTFFRTVGKGDRHVDWLAVFPCRGLSAAALVGAETTDKISYSVSNRLFALLSRYNRGVVREVMDELDKLDGERIDTRPDTLGISDGNANRGADERNETLLVDSFSVERDSPETAVAVFRVFGSQAGDPLDDLSLKLNLKLADPGTDVLLRRLDQWDADGRPGFLEIEATVRDDGEKSLIASECAFRFDRLYEHKLQIGPTLRKCTVPIETVNNINSRLSVLAGLIQEGNLKARLSRKPAVDDGIAVQEACL